MVQLAAMIACQPLREYRIMLGAALTAGVTPVEVKEIVYQAVPYVGMAKAFALTAPNELVFVSLDEERRQDALAVRRRGEPVWFCSGISIVDKALAKHPDMVSGPLSPPSSRLAAPEALPAASLLLGRMGAGSSAPNPFLAGLRR